MEISTTLKNQKQKMKINVFEYLSGQDTPKERITNRMTIVDFK